MTHECSVFEYSECTVLVLSKEMTDTLKSLIESAIVSGYADEYQAILDAWELGECKMAESEGGH